MWHEEINILKPEQSDLSFILVDISQKCTAEVAKTEQTFLRLMLADQPPPPYFNTFQDIFIGFGWSVEATKNSKGYFVCNSQNCFLLFRETLLTPFPVSCKLSTFSNIFHSITNCKQIDSLMGWDLVINWKNSWMRIGLWGSVKIWTIKTFADKSTIETR